MARWVRLWDTTFDNEWLTEPRRPRTKWEAWVDVFTNLAQWQGYHHVNGYQTVELARGELVVSRRYLARRWRWGEQSVETFLQHLENRSMIRSQRRTRTGTVYLVVNYERYQGGEEVEIPATIPATIPFGSQEQESIRHIEASNTVEVIDPKALKTLSSNKRKTSLAVVPSTNGKPHTFQQAAQRGAEVVAAMIREADVEIGRERAREGMIDFVFAYWAAKTGHKSALLDHRRANRLRSRLLENDDDVNELLFTVDGLLKDRQLMGDNQYGRKYDGIETCFRDRGMVERLAAAGGYQPGKLHRMVERYTNSPEAKDETAG